MYQLKFPLWLIKQTSRSGENSGYLLNNQGQLFVFTTQEAAAVLVSHHAGSDLLKVSRENLEAVLTQLEAVGQEAICANPRPDETSGVYFSIRELAGAVG